MHTSAVRPSGSERQAPHRVLVVDDEPGVRHLAVRILAEEGYQVDQASDGHEALEIIKNVGSAVDAVVSDIVMPRVTGIDLLEALSVSHPGLPVVLMSGYGVEQLKQRGIASPCTVLPKPFTPERLVSEVRRCISERR